jgi:hypothetical protein
MSFRIYKLPLVKVDAVTVVDGVGAAVHVDVVVVVPPLGGCQKSPQPARSAAAANNSVQRPIFIAAPLSPSSE